MNAGDFFQDLYTTDMASDELIVACEFPLQPSTTVCAFEELARRHGDYAIVGLAAVAQASGPTLSNLRLVFLGAGNIPVRAKAVERVLEGKPLGAELLTQAQAALALELAPAADLYNSAEMKQHLAKVLLNRALAKLTA